MTTTAIPLLTLEELEGIGRVSNGPGRLVKSWTQLTRLVRERLLSGRPTTSTSRSRLYRDSTHYLEFAIAPTGALHIEFGHLSLALVRKPLGRLDARWDELGLTGPYEVTLRNSAQTINTFCAVLEHFLTLPEPS